MEQSFNAMQVAMRVLKAISLDKKDPEQADVEELKRLLPLRSNVSPDELACEVIRQALERRQEIHRQGGSDKSGTT